LRLFEEACLRIIRTEVQDGISLGSHQKSQLRQARVNNKESPVITHEILLLEFN
jgi:hypothetical protein